MPSPLPPLDDYANAMPLINELENAQAKTLAGWIYEKLCPKSVIDIGCGTGVYLQHLIDLGVVDALGVDAERTGGGNIPGRFQIVDLRTPYDPGRRYDLGICIEVAEHIQAPYAQTLVDTIAGCADNLIFTAAIPGQGGFFHWNEQPLTYWMEKLSAAGYEMHPMHEDLIEHLQLPHYISWMRNCLLLKRKVE